MQYLKKDDYRNYFRDVFGISEDILKKYHFYETSSSVWAYTGDAAPLSEAEVVGVRALRVRNITKPTTSFLRIIGKYATKNVVFIDDEQGSSFLSGESLIGVCQSLKGYVVVRTASDVLGCGLCRNGILISQVPKKYRPDITWL